MEGEEKLNYRLRLFYAKCETHVKTIQAVSMGLPFKIDVHVSLVRVQEIQKH
jgi:hypothetical protein